MLGDLRQGLTNGRVGPDETFFRLLFPRRALDDQRRTGIVRSVSFDLESRFVEPLRSSAGAAFSRTAQGDVIADVGGLRVVVNADEVLFMLEAIFVEGEYDLEFRYPAVVWDIGMNRGVASLYFARRDNVVAIVGYEPFAPTYECARDNFALNPDLARKIRPHNHGIGIGYKTLRATYCAEWSGNMRVDELPEWLAREPGLSLEDLEISLLDAGETLDRILAEHPGVHVVAKIDCEGSEYEILEALHRSGRLASIKAVLVEWHLRGPAPLVDVLADAGFTVLSRGALPDRGMIYAVR
jgi:FkbM family methyltransferase